MARDNISGIKGGIFKTLFLFPGMIIQWIMYMSVGKLRYGQLRQNTRLARSPFMTWVFSLMAWGYLGLTVYETPELVAYLPNEWASEIASLYAESRKPEAEEMPAKRKVGKNPSETVETKRQGFVTMNAPLFSNASQKSDVVKMIPAGSEIEILGWSTDKEWYRASFEDKGSRRHYEGYIKLDAVALLVMK
jgi:hypothetical protein